MKFPRHFGEVFRPARDNVGDVEEGYHLRPNALAGKQIVVVKIVDDNRLRVGSLDGVDDFERPGFLADQKIDVGFRPSNGDGMSLGLKNIDEFPAAQTRTRRGAASENLITYAQRPEVDIVGHFIDDEEVSSMTAPVSVFRHACTYPKTGVPLCATASS